MTWPITWALALFLALPDAPAPGWEIAKGVLLFAITTLLAFTVKLLWGMRDLVRDHETAIYGRNGENGLKRGLSDVTVRVGAIEKRNTTVDAFAEAERAQYHGPERRHAAIRELADLIRAELKEDRA